MTKRKDEKVYDIKGTRWVMRELTWGEFEKAKMVVGDLWKQITPDTLYGEFVDKLLSQGCAGELFKIILVPKGKSLIHTSINEFRIRRRGINRHDPIGSMTPDQVLKVLIDFFIYSVDWMNSLTIMDGKLELKPTTEIAKEGLTTLMKWSSRFRRGTSEEESIPEV